MRSRRWLGGKCTPVLRSQTRHRGEVGVRRDDRAVAECQRNRGHLNVNLLHGPTDATKLRIEPTIFPHSRGIERPENERGDSMTEDVPVLVACRAGLDTSDEFSQNWKRNSDFRAAKSRLSRSLVNA